MRSLTDVIYSLFKQKYSPHKKTKTCDSLTQLKGGDSSWLPPSKAILDKIK